MGSEKVVRREGSIDAPLDDLSIMALLEFEATHRFTTEQQQDMSEISGRWIELGDSPTVARMKALRFMAANYDNYQ